MLLKDAQSCRRSQSNLLLLPAGGTVGAEFRRRKGNISRISCVSPGRRPPPGQAPPPEVDRPDFLVAVCGVGGDGGCRSDWASGRGSWCGRKRDSGWNQPGVMDHAVALGAASGVSRDISGRAERLALGPRVACWCGSGQ